MKDEGNALQGNADNNSQPIATRKSNQFWEYLQQQQKHFDVDGAGRQQQQLVPAFARKESDQRLPQGFWSNKNNHRLFLDWAGNQLNVRTLDDWYAITPSQVRKLGGSGLLQGYYHDSLPHALSAVYPHHEWHLWKFQHTPKGFWEDTANHRKFFDWAATQLNLQKLPDDWYDITPGHIGKLGGSGLLNRYYSDSMHRALSAVYPEYEWLPWRFSTVPTRFWEDPANHKRFFDWVAAQLNVRRLPDDWYGISQEQVCKLGGAGLLKGYYKNSLQRALSAVYPQHEWGTSWRFQNTTRGFWEDKANHRKFFDWVGTQLNVQHLPDDWYRIAAEQVYKLGGAWLLKGYYNGSLIRALNAVYPEHEWDPWKFQWCLLGRDELVDERALRRFVEGPLAAAFQVEKLEDWYRVPVDHARRTVSGYSTVVGRHGGLAAVLMKLYPEYGWDEQRLKSKDKRASQRALVLAMQQLFPGEDMIEEYAHQWECVLPSLSNINHHHDYS